MLRVRADTVSELRLLGGRLCLDFANTVDPRDGPDPRDFLREYGDLVRWGRLVGLLSESSARKLRKRGDAEPRSAAAALRKAIELREAIFRTFLALSRGSAPKPDDLDLIRSRYVEALAGSRLRESEGTFAWRPTDRDSLSAFLAPVSMSAVELLTSPALGRVKECAAQGDCGWLFLDTSKSGARRWCRMGGCGARAKARRYYARQRSGRSRRPAQRARARSS
jgi:predicted RNA-binding Zn ribbon-like protein